MSDCELSIVISGETGIINQLTWAREMPETKESKMPEKTGSDRIMVRPVDCAGRYNLASFIHLGTTVKIYMNGRIASISGRVKLLMPICSP